MKKNKNCLVVFLKNPVLGKAKTRIAKTVGDQQALNIYIQLRQVTFDTLSKIRGIDVVLYFDGHEEPEIQFSNLVHTALQKGEDLGQKMYDALRSMSLIYEKVAIIGTDCPYITPVLLESAFEQMDTSDAVLGPAVDGGYYLIGTKIVLKELFSNINWSTSKVAEQTIRKFEDSNMRFTLLPRLSDIDEYRDWLDYQNWVSDN